MRVYKKQESKNCEVCGAPISPKKGRGRINLYCETCSQELRKSFYVTPLRYSGEKYENTKEKLEAVREKYKNGVTKAILTEWIG